MNRVYLSVSTKELKEDDLARYLLSYLLIRSTARTSCGFFNLQKFMSATKLKERASKNHISRLLQKKFIRKISKDRYQVVSQRKLFGKCKRAMYFSISDKELFSFSGKKIAAFRAFLVELECERYKIHQRAKARGYTVTNERDGSKEVVKNPRLKDWESYMANSCTAALVDISQSTSSNYRRLQKLSLYKFKVVVLSMPKSKECLIMDKSSGSLLKSAEVKGKVFRSGDAWLWFPISKREPMFQIRRA